MEDNWAIDSKAKWSGQRSEADNPNHRQSTGEAGLSQAQSGHVVQGWPQADAATNNAALIDDAIGQFGNLTIGEPAVQGVIEPLRTVASVQVAGEGHGMTPPRLEGNVFTAGSIQSPFPTQSQGMAANGAPLEWGARYQHNQYRQQGVVGERESFPNVGGGASSCGARGQQGIRGGWGSDGVWRDEQGKRLYTEEEVREAVSQECRAWRDHSASLETQLAKTKDEATAALKGAEKVIAEMAEKLRMSESKTYALSVHLAKSNRPPHVA